MTDQKPSKLDAIYDRLLDAQNWDTVRLAACDLVVHLGATSVEWAGIPARPAASPEPSDSPLEHARTCPDR